MSHPLWPLMGSSCALAEISFLGVMVGTMLLVAPLPILQALQLMEECSAPLQCSQQNACMVLMGYTTSWVSQSEISSSPLARPLFMVFIRIVTTVVTNCKL